jgi:hypothetical protein
MPSSEVTTDYPNFDFGVVRLNKRSCKKGGK